MESLKPKTAGSPERAGQSSLQEVKKGKVARQQEALGENPSPVQSGVAPAAPAPGGFGYRNAEGGRKSQTDALDRRNSGKLDSREAKSAKAKSGKLDAAASDAAKAEDPRGPNVAQSVHPDTDDDATPGPPGLDSIEKQSGSKESANRLGATNEAAGGKGSAGGNGAAAGGERPRTNRVRKDLDRKDSDRANAAQNGTESNESGNAVAEPAGRAKSGQLARPGAHHERGRSRPPTARHVRPLRRPSCRPARAPPRRQSKGMQAQSAPPSAAPGKPGAGGGQGAGDAQGVELRSPSGELQLKLAPARSAGGSPAPNAVTGNASGPGQGGIADGPSEFVPPRAVAPGGAARTGGPDSRPSSSERKRRDRAPCGGSAAPATRAPPPDDFPSARCPAPRIAAARPTAPCRRANCRSARRGLNGPAPLPRPSSVGQMDFCRRAAPPSVTRRAAAGLGCAQATSFSPSSASVCRPAASRCKRKPGRVLRTPGGPVRQAARHSPSQPGGRAC